MKAIPFFFLLFSPPLPPPLAPHSVILFTPLFQGWRDHCGRYLMPSCSPPLCFALFIACLSLTFSCCQPSRLTRVTWPALRCYGDSPTGMAAVSMAAFNGSAHSLFFFSLLGVSCQAAMMCSHACLYECVRRCMFAGLFRCLLAGWLSCGLLQMFSGPGASRQLLRPQNTHAALLIKRPAPRRASRQDRVTHAAQSCPRSTGVTLEAPGS